MQSYHPSPNNTFTDRIPSAVPFMLMTYSFYNWKPASPTLLHPPNQFLIDSKNSINFMGKKCHDKDYE